MPGLKPGLTTQFENGLINLSRSGRDEPA